MLTIMALYRKEMSGDWGISHTYLCVVCVYLFYTYRWHIFLHQCMFNKFQFFTVFSNFTKTSLSNLLFEKQDTNIIQSLFVNVIKARSFLSRLDLEKVIFLYHLGQIIIIHCIQCCCSMGQPCKAVFKVWCIHKSYYFYYYGSVAKVTGGHASTPFNFLKVQCHSEPNILYRTYSIIQIFLQLKSHSEKINMTDHSNKFLARKAVYWLYLAWELPFDTWQYCHQCRRVKGALLARLYKFFLLAGDALESFPLGLSTVSEDPSHCLHLIWTG